MEETLSQWFAPGLDISLDYPTDENPKYRASVEEFGLSAEGDSVDDAYEAVARLVVEMVVARLVRGESLPDRTAWLEAHKRHSDSGDG